MATPRAQSSKAILTELDSSAPPATLDQARELLLEYGRFVISQPGAARFCFGALEKEAERLPLSYTEQSGGCLLAAFRSEPVGFVAWRSIAASPQVVADAWELKRLWVRSQARGLGLGRQLTESVLERAVAAGRKAVYLDTVPAAMATAHRLYLEMGFVPCASYNDQPLEGIAYMVRFL